MVGARTRITSSRDASWCQFVNGTRGVGSSVTGRLHLFDGGLSLILFYGATAVTLRH